MFSVIVVKVFVNVPLTILRLFLYQEYVDNVDSLILLVISIELVLNILNLVINLLLLNFD